VLRVEKFTKSFGTQLLFDSVDWFLGDHDRVGLVGRNGTGKSTLLKIMAGQETPDRGAVSAPRGQRVGYLPQFGFETGPGSVLEEARRAFSAILAWRYEAEEIEARLASDGVDPAEAEALLLRHAELDALFRQHGGYDVERHVHQVLTGLGFSERDFDRPVRALSGGWQMRVALAQLLLTRPDVLLLDEPTNHLDIEARVWLEGFLANYPGGFVIVSHDRHFLDRTVNRVTEIMGRTLIDYDGNYSRYRELREARYELSLKAYRAQQDEIRRIEDFIARNRVRKDRAAQVQSRLKMLEKMERLEPPVPPMRPIRFRFPQPAASGRIVMRLSQVHKAYGNQTVFEALDFEFEKGEKVALVGVNGAGKSTLMRILAGREPVQSGTREVGHKVAIEFFAQDQADQLPRDRSILDETIDRCPVALVPQARGLLGAFLFRGEEVEKRIAVLSGGERNRLALMFMLLRPANLLLLDEPTNHLDIEAQEVLLAALNDFDGTVVFVSHDHHFLEKLATRVVEVGGGDVRVFPGDYESYLWKKEQEALARAAADLAAARVAEPSTGSRGADETVASNPARERAREDRRRVKRLGEVESRIGELEERRGKLEDLMASDGFFRDPEKSRFYVDEHRETVEELEELYKEWHALSEEHS
jgi:ATP-binding cassette, subfamily F, member 3